MPRSPKGGPLRALPLATLLLVAARPARAGMPSLTLTDLAAARLQTLSFFLLLFFLSALAIQRLWNYLRRDFPRLPPLTYRRACAATGLWGLLFVLVLTMISGARELMTPGAWDKNGLTYRLKSGPDADAARSVWTATLAARPTRLRDLKLALWSYADLHAGHLPADDQTPFIAPTAWETPDLSRIRYVYLPGHTILPGGTPGAPVVAYEPQAFPAPRLALFADGEIRELAPADLRAAVDRSTTRPAATQPSAAR